METEMDVSKALEKHRQYLGRRYVEGSYLSIVSCGRLKCRCWLDFLTKTFWKAEKKLVAAGFHLAASVSGPWYCAALSTHLYSVKSSWSHNLTSLVPELLNLKCILPLCCDDHGRKWHTRWAKDVFNQCCNTVIHLYPTGTGFATYRTWTRHVRPSSVCNSHLFSPSSLIVPVMFNAAVCGKKIRIFQCFPFPCHS